MKMKRHLFLGGEKEEDNFKSSSETESQKDDDMFRDGSDERPYENRFVYIEAREKGQSYIEAVGSKERYMYQTDEEGFYTVRSLYNRLRDDNEAVKSRCGRLNKKHYLFLKGS